jgi:quercetin dioxygenase-like cupin family protein
MFQHRKTGQELEKIHSDGAVYNLKVASWETGGVYEVWEMIFEKGKKVPYHEHHNSRETFFITEGSIEFTLAGNKFMASAGDVIHVPPYMPHSMVFLKNTTWMAYFNNYKFYDAIKESNMLKAHNPDALEKDKYITDFGNRTDSHALKSPEEVLKDTQSKS